MKTLGKVCLMAMLLLLPLVAFAGGSGASSGAGAARQPQEPAHITALRKVVATDSTWDELLKLAQAEGRLIAYSPSSRHSRVAQEFGAKFGIGRIEVTTIPDTEMIEKVYREAAANVDAADVVFVQDGGRVFSELLEPGHIISYTPPALRNVIPKQFQNPQVWDLCTKQFIFNNEKSQAEPIKNIWEVTEPDWRGRVQFKDPFSEGVNMNFLTMITKPEIANKIAQAYRQRYGKDIALTTPNAGYEWIKAFYANGLILGRSDTTMSEVIGAKGQSSQLMGLFTLNKVREAAAKNIALQTTTNLAPFTGFYYPIYTVIPSNSRSPNAAKLFIEYCLSEEGFGPWNTLGDYSPNPQVVNTEDPIPLSQWMEWLIYEDPEWTAENRPDIEDFVNSIM